MLGVEKWENGYEGRKWRVVHYEGGNNEGNAMALMRKKCRFIAKRHF